MQRGLSWMKMLIFFGFYLIQTAWIKKLEKKREEGGKKKEKEFGKWLIHNIV